MKNFIFYYFMNEKSVQIKTQASEHAKYWHTSKKPGGPFADFSGGFIIFSAKDIQEAKSMISQDPFMIHGLLAQHWLKEWISK